MLLGEDHPNTIEVKKRLLYAQTANGERYVSVFELQDKVLSLDWDNSNSNTVEYNIGTMLSHICRGEDCTITHKQVRNVVAAAARHARTKASSSPGKSLGGQAAGGSLLGVGSPGSVLAGWSSSSSTIGSVLDDDGTLFLEQLTGQLLDGLIGHADVQGEDIAVPVISDAEVRQAVRPLPSTSTNNERKHDKNDKHDDKHGSRRIPFGPRLERKHSFVDEDASRPSASQPHSGSDRSKEEGHKHVDNHSKGMERAKDKDPSNPSSGDKTTEDISTRGKKQQKRRKSQILMPAAMVAQMEGQLQVSS